MTRQMLNKTSGKLDLRGHIGYLAGYISSTQYLIWVPSLQRNAFFNTSHVIFNEKVFFGRDQREGVEKQQQEQINWIDLSEDLPDFVDEQGCLAGMAKATLLRTDDFFALITIHGRGGIGHQGDRRPLHALLWVSRGYEHRSIASLRYSAATFSSDPRR
ncbi:hypothetical protein G6O67_001030 [Ophiocordyceps sinensis]|uniref:Retroviral polymerase SH3-like domain-containing protein n=2 Tax=Ophiocordyceps sinensis TaxID=72228 RepID=A0A8H4PWM2_9HYPO|nr:hypothetical protein OCS_01310 [Ophiocordyceps sinensis CO18]KAF4511822.1 hypothetical protein G6O67_001030 [Ophiocordyceps sinensis]